MKTIKILFASVAVLVIGGMLSSMSIQSTNSQDPWEVPAKYKAMKNPVANNAESQALGAAAYKKNCASCHGRVGLGDGVKARTLETFAGDFSGAAYQGQTDGEHFYKTKFGRGEMPAYDKKIPDEDIWNMVNYMRTFKK